MVINIILFVILLACVAMLYKEGLWSNAVRLVNLIMAALLAMNYFEPLANALDGWDSSYTFVWDFLSLWVLFALFSFILKVLTDKLSQVKVKFLKIVDQIGSVVLALWIGWVMVCFTTTTLHTAPLSSDFAGFAVGTEEQMFFGAAPDRLWLAFMQKESLGCYGHSPANAPDQHVFDPDGNFMPTYHTRRAKCQINNDKNSSILLTKGANWWTD